MPTRDSHLCLFFWLWYQGNAELISELESILSSSYSFIFLFYGTVHVELVLFQLFEELKITALGKEGGLILFISYSQFSTGHVSSFVPCK